MATRYSGPAFTQTGKRVKYVYTDGSVPAGTLGTIEGWLPRPYRAQIRWDNDTLSSHTPDEFDIVRRCVERSPSSRSGLKFVVRGKSGKIAGRYATRAEAEHRIAQLKAGAARLKSYRFSKR